MRNQFYGDAKDIQKWTVVFNVAKIKSRSIYWVVMLCPDQATNHGRDSSAVSWADPIVASFFEEERSAGRKDLRRVAVLAEGMGIPIEINLAHFSNKSRRTYMADVKAFLCDRSAIRRDVIFFDPDNGLAGATPKSEHLRIEDLLGVWNALREGDVAIIYQHRPRFAKDGWDSKKKDVIASILKTEVQMRGEREVRFYLANK